MCVGLSSVCFKISIHIKAIYVNSFMLVWMKFAKGKKRLMQYIYKGCLNGGSVCSTSEYNTTTVCPNGGVGMPVCQNVKMPVCYGNLGTCNYPTQQCCVQNSQRVCQNIPERAARYSYV